jgi:hypothetical protein
VVAGRGKPLASSAEGDEEGRTGIYGKIVDRGYGLEVSCVVVDFWFSCCK